MKKIISLFLALCIVFALCACGETAQEAAPAPTAEVTAAPAADPAPSAQPESNGDPIADQIVLLFNSICMLKTNPDYAKYWYTVTDFDHNGRLEVTGAVTEGTGSYTSALIYEVGEDMKTLNNVDLGLKEGEFLPEIIKSKVDVYHTADGAYNYIFFDSCSVDAGNHAQTIEALSLADGKLALRPLGFIDISTKDGNTAYSFTDVNGAPLADQAAFLALAPNAFPGAIKEEITIDWFALSDIYSTDRLAKSYSVFMGLEKLDVDPIITPIPEYTPSPAPTPTPTPTPAADPVVTKNPTAESVIEGGSCQFVARADNASSMRWMLMDKNGNVYDAAKSPFAGQLRVSGVTSTCLTLSNIPLGMNGYRAYAEFYGTTTIQSKAATVSVSPVPIATVSASANNGTNFFDLNNTVYLYSSNGANIHYECIKQGDSGPYASADVGNGAGITIAGIEGQRINVEVYANVIGSEKVSYFVFTVDRQPAPAPTEWTEYGTVIGDTFVEVKIQTPSGIYYVDKSACMFGGTGIASVGDSASVTFRNGEVLIAVITCTGTFGENNSQES